MCKSFDMGQKVTPYEIADLTAAKRVRWAGVWSSLGQGYHPTSLLDWQLWQAEQETE